MSIPLHFNCVSLLSPVGLTPASAAAAMRVGIDGFSQLRFHDTQGEPIMGAPVPGMPEDLQGRARIVELLGRAFENCPDLPYGATLESVPILICVREPERPGARLNSIVGDIERRLKVRFRRDRSAYFASGPVSCFEALRRAGEILADDESEMCLIAAVDTLLEARTLNWLDEAKRLKTSEHTDGVTPGEAACLALVSREPFIDPGFSIQGVGFGHETATILNDEPLLARGLETAARMALDEAGCAMHDIAFRLSDVAGESYAFEELALVQTRLMTQRRETQDVWLPASSVGDCGAAAGLIQIAWAEQAFLRGYAPGAVALAHGSTATGARAAAVVGI